MRKNTQFAVNPRENTRVNAANMPERADEYASEYGRDTQDMQKDTQLYSANSDMLLDMLLELPTWCADLYWESNTAPK